MRKILLFSIFILCSLQVFAQSDDFVPSTVIVKLDESASAKGTNEKLLSGADLASLTSVRKIDNIAQYKTRQERGANTKSILDGIYKIRLNTEVDELTFINSLSSFSNVIYAERYPNVKPFLVPNDPQARRNGPQYHLDQVGAYDAWNITQGDEDLVIAIVDTGVDLDHEDLQGNLYVNADEIPDDGIDNDGDGFIDNYRGWDFADNDNAPEADGDQHGTLVTGVAAAATNNALGIAGLGYRCKFLPIKIFQTENNFSSNSYEGVIYAANQGADVINLSWGGVSGFSQYAQDVINYAVLEKDAAVVAAAGNTNANLDFYPASYDNVLSVGFVNNADQRDPNSTYSNFIDLVAPGVNIYSTFNNDSYGTEGGSSLAAPIVAGAAALLRERYPDYSAVEIMEQLRVNADDIYDVSSNSQFEYLFGKGRLNVSRAVSNDENPSVRMQSFEYSNGFEEAAYYGDTLTINAEFQTYLNDVEDLSITLSSDNPYVTLVDSVLQIGSVTRNNTFDNNSVPFRVILSDNLPENEKLYFRLNYEGAFYEDYQNFVIFSSPRTEIFSFANWRFGLNSTGVLGKNRQYPFSTFSANYNGSTLVGHSGIILAASVDSISKNTLINPLEFAFEEDFESMQKLKRFDDITADFDVRSTFKEQATLDTTLGLEIRQRILGWEASGENEFILFEYELENRGDLNYDSLFFELFTEWAVIDDEANTLKYDSANEMVYAYDNDQSLYGGLALIADQDSVFYPFDLDNLNGNTSDLENDTLTNSLIWESSMNAFSEKEAGINNEGNSVGSLLGVLLKDFQSGQSQTINFALLAANDLTQLQNVLSSAKEKLASTKQNRPFGAQLFICENETPSFQTASTDSLHIYLTPTADSVAYEGRTFDVGPLQSDSVFYYEVIDEQGFASIRKRLIVSVIKPTASFEVASTPYLITPNSNTLISFNDSSEEAVEWNWTFSNGYQSTQQNPRIPFSQEGMVDIQLVATNAIGCTDTITKSIEIAFRGITPDLATNQLVCSGSDVVITDPAISEISVYEDAEATSLIYRGATYTIENIQTDSTFYVRNEQQTYPSEMVKVELTIAEIRADFQVYDDLSTSNTEMRALAVNKSIATDITWLIRGENVGTSDSLYFNLQGFTSGDLQLVAVNDFGCTDTLTFNQTQSESPVFDDYFLCQGQSVTFKASNTGDLYFFADEALSQFLGKGNQLFMNEVEASTEIWAVNVTNIVPSQSVKIPLQISNVAANFELPSDTINLAYDEAVSVTADSSSAISWKWDLGNGVEKTGRTITLDYQEAGIYYLVLSVEDSLKCVESMERRIVVYDDPVLGNREQLREYFTLFPNPANQFIHLEAIDNFNFDSYTIVDIDGKEVLKKVNDKPKQRAEVISVSSLPEGVYYLVIHKKKHKASFLFLIRR